MFPFTALMVTLGNEVSVMAITVAVAVGISIVLVGVAIGADSVCVATGAFFATVGSAGAAFNLASTQPCVNTAIIRITKIDFRYCLIIRLLVPQGFNRFEIRSAAGGVDPKEQTNDR
jgi:hypothetical protein